MQAPGDDLGAGHGGSIAGGCGILAAMPRAVVLSAVRTPVGRYGGGLAGVRPDDLAAAAIAAAVERAGVPAGRIDDVWLGCANQAGEDNRNVARFAALLAGLPTASRGVTVNRLCASGLSAVVGACHAVIAGDGDLFVAGGVESMTRAPLVTAKPDEAVRARRPRRCYDTTLGWRFVEPALRGAVHARRWARRARTSPSAGASRARIRTRSRSSRSSAGPPPTRPAASPTSSCPSAGSSATSTRGPRPRAEKLATLKPAFRAGGTVTAGNASGINDGAAALVIASEERARELGVEPLGAFLGSAVGRRRSARMGLGPIPAVASCSTARRRAAARSTWSS